MPLKRPALGRRRQRSPQHGKPALTHKRHITIGQDTARGETDGLPYIHVHQMDGQAALVGAANRVVALLGTGGGDCRSHRVCYGSPARRPAVAALNELGTGVPAVRGLTPCAVSR